MSWKSDKNGASATSKLLAFLHAHLLIILVVLLPLVSLFSVFLVPYGSASIVDCSTNSFLSFCVNLTAGSTLFGYAAEAVGGSIVVLAALVLELCLTVFGVVSTWVVALPWSQDRGITGTVGAAGFLFTLGPWAGLQPTWGYWVITIGFWVSLVAARVYRGEKTYQGDWGPHAAEPPRWVPPEEPPERPSTPPPSEHGAGKDAPPPDVHEAAVVLGVKVSDSPQAIDIAYKRWVKTLHPDRNPSPTDATQQLQRINNARDILLRYSSRRKTR